MDINQYFTLFGRLLPVFLSVIIVYISSVIENEERMDEAQSVTVIMNNELLPNTAIQYMEQHTSLQSNTRHNLNNGHPMSIV